MVRNTYIYPPGPSMRIVADIIEYTARHMPKFNSISISGYHMEEAGATSVQELAFTLADGLEYVRAALSRGLAIDEFAPRLSFFFGIGMNFFMEIAKLRAARVLVGAADAAIRARRTRRASPCARIARPRGSASPSRTRTTTSSARRSRRWRRCSAAPSHCTPTRSTRRWRCRPRPRARIARNTQLILAEETGIPHVVDPLGGSYYVESLTHSIAAAAMALIDEVEALGGMTKAVESRHAEIAHRGSRGAAPGGDRPRRGGRSSGSTNTGRARPPRSTFSMSTTRRCATAQIARLERVRRSRDPARVEAALAALTEAAQSGKGNLLALSIEASRARATVGEISDALETVFTRHRAQIRVGQSASMAANTRATRASAGYSARSRLLPATKGRRPRMLVVKLGQDGHDRGAKVIATAFADIGFDVDIGPLFQTPEEAARQAVENDVHIVGVSSQAAGHKTLVPALIEALKREGAGDILVVVGGVIPPKDYDFLKKAGVSAIFGPGTNIPAAAAEILSLIQKHRLAA